MSADPTVTQEDLGALHQSEVDLVWLIRTKYRYGTVEILTRDGLPADILKTTERERLGSGVKLNEG